MSEKKQGLGINVLQAAQGRMARIFDDFPRIYVSFSGGKDSTVMMHLVLAEARRRGRKVGVLFVDLEAQYAMTIEHVEQMFAEYEDVIEPFWVALPLSLRNAVSQFEPQWRCWDESARECWVREPSSRSITDVRRWEWMRPGMEFEDFVPAFGEWYAQGKLCCCFVGIRTAESLNRWRTIASAKKQRFEGLAWTTRVIEAVYNAYPIYDWATEDIWTFLGRHRLSYNRLYDRMHQAGLTIHQQRICQPYGDDQRKGLWLFQVIEPETWARVVARVNGANQGSLYAQDSGNILGRIKITKPAAHSWESFTKMLLATLPPKQREHYENKIAVFLHWYEQRGYSRGIPDEGSTTDRTKPSWARICKVLLRNDYWCKGLSFTQHKTEAYEKYMKLMKVRRAKWGIS
jgi:predicted phosphoadenosine phosphosulfate sulfurtransferase